jgi:hypothetical protein
VTQRVDQIVDCQPYADRDKDQGANFEEHLGGLRIGSLRLVVSGPFGSAISGIVERERVPQEIAHELSSFPEYYALFGISDRDEMRVFDVSQK